MKMPINPVAQTDAAQFVFQAAAANADQAQASAKESAPAKTAPVITDTVQISSSAKAVMQEAIEPAAQNVQEAAAGDRQAQRLVAKEDAAKEVKEPPLVKPQEAQGSLVSRFFNNVK
jgi:hypothetical protein